jgi:hypothetical protein
MVRPAGAAPARTSRCRSGPGSVEERSLAREDVADALQVLGWHRLHASDSGADRLYADGAGRRLRISHQLA